MLPMTELSGEHNTVQAAVTAGDPLSPTQQRSRDTAGRAVIVRKEVRQGSEHTYEV